VFIHEGSAQTVFNEFAVAAFAREVVGELKSTPTRVVGTVKIEDYYYITKATQAVAKAVCLDMPELERAIECGLNCVWILTEPDRFGSPPLSKSIGKRRGVVTWANANVFPKLKFSHVSSKFMSGNASLIESTSDGSAPAVHRSSWTFEKEFKKEVDNAVGRLYTEAPYTL